MSELIKQLVELGNGLGGTRMDGKTKEELEKQFDEAKQRSLDITDHCSDIGNHISPSTVRIEK